MASPFIGQLMLASWSYAAKGWALSNGQLLPINQNQALFSLLGTYYGGDGRTTFALPNLQGRIPIGTGNGYSIGNPGGEAAHTLTAAEVPTHSHTVNAAGTGANSTSPGGALLGGGGGAAFVAPNSLAAMNSSVISPFGGSQPHENRQPFLVMNWCIALQGIFPSQN
jgi:microcystin-dependent protein